MISEYRLSFQSPIRHTRLRLPYSGSSGFNRSPPYRSMPVLHTDHRYYAPLRLPIAHLEVLRYSLVPQYLITRIDLVRVPEGSLIGSTRHLQTPGILSFRYCPIRLLVQDTIGSLQFLDYPCIHMPWSQIPVVSHTLAIACMRLLPSEPLHAVGFTLIITRISLRTTTILISGLNTRPANSLHPASDTTFR